MSEDRLEIIKENVYMRSEIAKISEIGIDTSLKEELELIEEIDRLINLNKQLVEECQRLEDEETRLNNIINGLENIRKEAIDYMKEFIFEPLLINEDRKLIMFNENLKNFENILNKGSEEK